MTVKQHLLFAIVWIVAAGVLAVFGQKPAQPDLLALEDELFSDEAALFGDEAFGDEPFADGGQSFFAELSNDEAMARDAAPQQAAASAGGSPVVAVLDEAVLVQQGEVYRFYCCVRDAKADTDASRPDLVDLRRDEQATRLARTYHQKLYINPFALAGKVKIEASRSQGRMNYTVYPGSDPQAFAALGLQPGDNVLGVNGVSLQRSDAIPVLYQQLAAADYVAVTLERQGRPVVVLLSLAASV
ncbi:hypothetical protein FHR99_000921 [Litorivivens lipolytica]|uniref:General secretion pathway protein C n=1 Tax=Litorivivens lipolytica TaxID=1524264 RepID=A0A7W4Z686_9GAMM|nr:hypothetical protein [Litorivivens lipolytica]MBB3046685.1 hypothetical protein [Litorivivens lipolytica]